MVFFETKLGHTVYMHCIASVAASIRFSAFLEFFHASFRYFFVKRFSVMPKKKVDRTNCCVHAFTSVIPVENEINEYACTKQKECSKSKKRNLGIAIASAC